MAKKKPKRVAPVTAAAYMAWRKRIQEALKLVDATLTTPIPSGITESQLDKHLARNALLLAQRRDLVDLLEPGPLEWVVKVPLRVEI
jgi:hypothetical protein